MGQEGDAGMREEERDKGVEGAGGGMGKNEGRQDRGRGGHNKGHNQITNPQTVLQRPS